ncbi:MAG: PQQ-binding-like beta-propeller repeat protein [Saprospiraceae bacterium]|nr:PQQ-binding-like beta-propeller repeat protein [Saprospiraceae bacterium]
MMDVNFPIRPVWEKDLPKGTFFSFHDLENQMIGVVPKRNLTSYSKEDGRVVRSRDLSFHAIGVSEIPFVWGYMFPKEKTGHTGITGINLDDFNDSFQLTTNREVISLIVDDKLLAISTKEGEQFFQSYDLNTRALKWEKPVQTFSRVLGGQSNSVQLKTVQGVGNSSTCYLCSNEFGGLGVSWETGDILWHNSNLHSLVQRFKDKLIKLDSNTFEEYSMDSGDLIKTYSIKERLLNRGMQRFSNNWFTVTSEYVLAVEQLGSGIFAVNRETGAIEWSSSLGNGRLPYPPVVAGESLYTLDSEGQLYYFRKE